MLVDASSADGLCLPSAYESLSCQEAHHELTPRTLPTHSRRDRRCSAAAFPKGNLYIDLRTGSARSMTISSLLISIRPRGAP
jgi:hypothetical protein